MTENTNPGTMKDMTRAMASALSFKGITECHDVEENVGGIWFTDQNGKKYCVIIDECSPEEGDE